MGQEHLVDPSWLLFRQFNISRVFPLVSYTSLQLILNTALRNMPRKCSNCHRVGHNVRTCTAIVDPDDHSASHLRFRCLPPNPIIRWRVLNLHHLHPTFPSPSPPRTPSTSPPPLSLPLLLLPQFFLTPLTSPLSKLASLDHSIL